MRLVALLLAVLPITAQGDGEPVIFVPMNGGFEARRVRRGASDGKSIAVVDGLRQGEEYVSEGAFELKAQLITSGMDPHAGHGH